MSLKISRRTWMSELTPFLVLGLRVCQRNMHRYRFVHILILVIYIKGLNIYFQGQGVCHGAVCNKLLNKLARNDVRYCEEEY